MSTGSGSWIRPTAGSSSSSRSEHDHGVLDHDVTLPSGETVHNPMRVIPDGDGCEVVFTLGLLERTEA